MECAQDHHVSEPVDRTFWAAGAGYYIQKMRIDDKQGKGVKAVAVEQ